MKIRLLLFLFFSMSSIQAQEIYLVNSANTINIVNIETLQVTELFTVDASQAGYLTDIAFAPDGRFFGVTNGWRLIEIDILNQTFSFVADLPVGDPYTALVCNSQGQLLTSRTFSEELYAYDLNTSSLSMVATGISSPGDFTFYKGNLVYPNILNDFIKAYDGNTITSIGCSISFLYTFVNNFQDCESNDIYAFDQFANLYNFDLETENYELIANLFDELGLVNGGATQTEYMASACTVENLETVTCEILSVNEVNSLKFMLYPNPVTERVNILNPSQEIKNMEVYSLMGELLKTQKDNLSYVDLSNEAAGIYLLKITSIYGQISIQKIIKN